MPNLTTRGRRRAVGASTAGRRRWKGTGRAEREGGGQRAAGGGAEEREMGSKKGKNLTCGCYWLVVGIEDEI